MSIRNPRRPGAALARRIPTLALLIVVMAGLSPVLALAARPRVSFTQIESDVMCVACHEPLAVANSPEAYSERQYIRDLIAQGLDQRQIENQLVANYGTAVLGRPPATGFNLLVYVLPPVLVGLGLATLVITIPRWRRRAREAAPMASRPALDPADARRLDEDLGRRF